MKNHAAWFLFIPAALLYLLLAANAHWGLDSAVLTPYQTLLVVGGATVLWGSCLAGFYMTEFSSWTYLIMALVPLEFTHSFWRFPSLTPMAYIGMAAIVALAFKKHRTWQTDLTGIFDVWTLAAWASFFLYACILAFMLHGQLRGTFRWVLFLLGYFAAAKAGQEPAAPAFGKNACRFLALAGSLIGALAICQFIRSGYLYTQVTGTFKQHNSVGMFLSLCFPAAVYWAFQSRESSPALRLLQPLLIATGLVICHSRGAWMGLAAGGIGMILIRGTKRLSYRISGALVLLAISLFLARFIKIDLNGRNWYWQVGLAILRAHPWFGLGPGNYAANVGRYLTGEPLHLYRLDLILDLHFWLHLHNLYLQYAVEYGLLGGALFFIALGLIVSKAFRSYPTWINTACLISIIGFLVHNIVDILAVNSFDVLFGILIALAQIPSNPQENPLL